MVENVKPKFFYGYIIGVAAFFNMAILGGTIYSFGVFFKPLLTEFGWTRAMTSGAYSLRSLVGGFLGIVAGRLNDKVGPRVVVTVCGFFLGLGYLLMSQISAIWQLYLFYGVIVAIGVSGLWVPTVSTVSRWFVKRRGMVMGIVVSGIGFGTLIIPPLASWLISAYDWRTAYCILAIIASVLIILAAQFLRRDPTQMGQLPYGESGVKQQSPAIEAEGFSLREAIHTRQLWILCAMLVCFGLCLQTIMVHINPHATDLGISAISAANILAIIGGASIAGRVMMGSAGDRIGNKAAIIICFVLLSVDLFWLQLAEMVWMLYLFAAIFGFGYGGFIALMSPLVAELFGLSSHGIIFGVVNFSSVIGETVGPLLAGHIFDITSSYHLAFLFCIALTVVGLILSSQLGPIISKGGTNDS